VWTEALPVDSWRVEEAGNQVHFRDFNEWVKQSNLQMGNHLNVHEYICECSDGTCREPIRLSNQEYEAIREDGTRFAIAVNHENPEFDLVVAQNQRFTTIEKLPGESARLAFASDPRRAAATRPH
jgi:hypothetical protein